MKTYQCDCEYAIFPFGKGLPVCTRNILESRNLKNAKNCIEKGCEFYKAKGDEGK